MLIREFVPEDIKRVLQIENASFDQSYGFNMFMKLKIVNIIHMQLPKINFLFIFF